MKGDKKWDELIHLVAENCAWGGVVSVKVGLGYAGEAFNYLKNMIHVVTQ